MPFLEAIRQMRHELGRDDILNIHVTLLPYIKTADELKTKPTQHSVQELRRLGITPQMLILRAEETIPNEIKRKIAFTCDIDEESVIEAVDAPKIYQWHKLSRITKDYYLNSRIRLKKLQILGGIG